MTITFVPRDDAEAAAQIARTRQKIRKAKRWLSACYLLFAVTVGGCTFLALQHPTIVGLMIGIVGFLAFTIGANSVHSHLALREAERKLDSLEAFAEVASIIRFRPDGAK